MATGLTYVIGWIRQRAQALPGQRPRRDVVLRQTRNVSDSAGRVLVELDQGLKCEVQGHPLLIANALYERPTMVRPG